MLELTTCKTYSFLVLLVRYFSSQLAELVVYDSSKAVCLHVNQDGPNRNRDTQKLVILNKIRTPTLDNSLWTLPYNRKISPMKHSFPKPADISPWKISTGQKMKKYPSREISPSSRQMSVTGPLGGLL